MLTRIAAFVIWAAVAGSAAFWALRLMASPLQAPAHTTQVSAADAFHGDLARLFGQETPLQVAAANAAPLAPADARFRLIGVVAPRAPSAGDAGLAVISFDSKPAKAYSVGAAVDGELVLQSVHARGAALGPRGQPAQVSLELPALPPPATGSLPVAGSAQLPPPGQAGHMAPPNRPMPPGAQPPIDRPADADQATPPDVEPPAGRAPT